MQTKGGLVGATTGSCGPRNQPEVAVVGVGKAVFKRAELKKLGKRQEKQLENEFKRIGLLGRKAPAALRVAPKPVTVVKFTSKNARRAREAAAADTSPAAYPLPEGMPQFFDGLGETRGRLRFPGEEELPTEEERELQRIAAREYNESEESLFDPSDYARSRIPLAPRVMRQRGAYLRGFGGAQSRSRFR